MNVNDVLTFNTQVLFIALTIIAFVDYVRRGGARRRDFFLFAFALGFPLGITFLRRFTPLTSSFLNVAGAFALFSQPYFLFRLLQHFRPSRPRMGILILVGFLLCCVLLLARMAAAPALTVTIIFSYCAVAEAYTTWGFYQERRDTSGTLRRRLTIIGASSGIFTIAFVLNALKAQFPALNIGPVAQIAAAVSAILFYVAFIPPRWLRRAWQLEDLRGYIAQTKIAPANDFVLENLQRLSQSAEQITNGQAAAVVKLDSSMPVAVLTATDPELFARLSTLDPAFIQALWQSPAPAYQFVSRIADSNQRQQLKALGIQTWLLAPIPSQDHPSEVLMVALTDRSLFIDDDLEMLELLTQECVLVLDNHRLMEELQGSSERWGVQVRQRIEGISVLSRTQPASQTGPA